MALTALHVAIIGGGAIGVTAAYELSLRGVGVTLFEADALGHGASYGNAGLLVPSYSTPLASFANLREGARSIFGARSAVEVRLRPSLDTLRWMARFAAAGRKSAARRGLETLASLTRESLELYGTLLSGAPASVAYETTGTLYVARTVACLQESVALTNELATVGIASQTLTASEARAKEPTLSPSIAGALWYPGDASLQPLQYVNYIADRARAAGVTIRNEQVSSIVRKGNGVCGIRTASEVIASDYVVLAAGAWSADVARSVGLRVPILLAKGYSVDFTLAHLPRTSMLFSERHVSATPMNGVVRATTGLDFHGFDRTVAAERVDLIRTAYAEYLADVSIVAETPAWAGFWPLTPDGLPIVGRSSSLAGLAFAAGHGPLGITLAPVTARLVADTILGERVEPASISPKRFGL